ncbi:hypothetical protein LV457_14955 [Mycobacterium sp. MYCO198283]|uniref:ATP-grasp domain-containing protein n=1 Tax=Mycobacterium sp. MYCO198283 TaxID=2883505 RepID=UPI001E3C2A79|nr:hypothetical protein [Mycobacterium sp. MYCO198283]MCG5433577.1 hypothetical protein [Mycobacterium sp. MYCO198283]
MNLLRPDVFHPRIVLAGCPQLVSGDGDDAGLVPALRHRGLHARWLSWDDPDTTAADLVILRATWDYIDRLDEFTAWANSVPALLNPAPVVTWNTDKRYLLDLAAAGVPTIPTAVFGPDDALRFEAPGEVVVKPAVGAGSVGARRLTDQGAAAAHAAALQQQGRAVVVQPYDARVDSDGETALVFLGGEASHAFGKAAILPPGGAAPDVDPSGTFAAESLSAAEPDFAAWDVGHAALQAAADHLGIAVTDLLYARVDVIGGAADVRVLELELVEPSLGWSQLDETTRLRQEGRFARCVESALDRLGLGPLSHRRP